MPIAGRVWTPIDTLIESRLRAWLLQRFKKLYYLRFAERSR